MKSPLGYKNRFTLKEEEEEEMEFDQSAVSRKSIDLSRRPSEGRRRNEDRSIVTLERILFSFPNSVFAVSGAVRLTGQTGAG